jgi:hypothetical protein
VAIIPSSTQDSEPESQWEPEEDKIPPSVPSQTHGSFYFAKSPAYKALTIQEIESEFMASNFYNCLKDFLCKRGLLRLNPDFRTTLDADIRFDAWKRLVYDLPPVQEVSSLPTRDVICATPAFPSRGRQMAASARFDTVIAWKTERPDSQVQSESSGLQGINVAQVHCIFRLPSELGTFSTLLAYVEWFTDFRRPDPLTGMFWIQRSSRAHVRNASIIPIDQIIRSCHLIPVFGRRFDPLLTSHTALDLCSSFFLNHYLRHIDFVFYRACMRHMFS